MTILSYSKNAHGIEGGSDRYCATVTELLEFSDPFSLVFHRLRFFDCQAFFSFLYLFLFPFVSFPPYLFSPLPFLSLSTFPPHLPYAHEIALLVLPFASELRKERNE